MFIKKKLILKSNSYPLKTTHYRGFPPEATGGGDARITLPKARVLVIEETREGFYLYRYTENGDIAGDTWHPNLEEAIKQAEFEFGVTSDAWEDIPSEVTDCHAYIFGKN